MDVTIERPESEPALREFVQFHDQVYAGRAIRWPALLPFHMSILRGQSPFVEERVLCPLVARVDGGIVARAVAVVDHRYNRHWADRLGHINMFEALPGTRDAVRRLMDAAAEWLASQGMRTARAGFGMLEFPFVIDDYESLPPSVLRQNAPYVHALLKDAGFESERGWVDYKIEVRADLVARWRNALETVRRAGYAIVPLREVAAADRAPLFTRLWNEAFASHWGQSPFTEAEIALLFDSAAGTGMLDTSVFAYQAEEPVGVLWVTPENTVIARCRPGRAVRDSERLNFLGIGVRPGARGRGVNLGMAAYAFLELVHRGATHLSYTLVLDDNWPSRRTAERLGAHVCASYLTYRRELGR
jgi:RimJ/RimL family protein N-acetyltransferase